ncbi:MAG: ABC transporter ATP-binding protein [Deltaproteobacteria bacterium]|nr:ABC transporter ATP-binding protein [Deltaproteobacteria bacterium]
MMACLELKNIRFSYGGAQSVKDFSLSAGKGGLTGLIGPNGAGKSTVLKLACGILKPAGGEIKLFGKDLKDYPPKERAKLVSYLPQLIDVNIPFTVRELIGIGLYPRDAKASPHETDEAMEAVGLRGKRDSPVMELSAGERRRAFIAMSLVQGSSLLLLDEPLANLDLKYQIGLVRLLRKIIEERGISVVMALHDINTAFSLHSVCVIKDGCMYAHGAPRQTITKDVLKEVFEVDWENFPTPAAP